MSLLGTVAGYFLCFIFLSYLVPHFIVALLLKPRDLKKTYSANWGLVTGASSGAAQHDRTRSRACLFASPACATNFVLFNHILLAQVLGSHLQSSWHHRG